ICRLRPRGRNHAIPARRTTNASWIQAAGFLISIATRHSLFACSRPTLPEPVCDEMSGAKLYNSGLDYTLFPRLRTDPEPVERMRWCPQTRGVRASSVTLFLWREVTTSAALSSGMDGSPNPAKAVQLDITEETDAGGFA